MGLLSAARWDALLDMTGTGAGLIAAAALLSVIISLQLNNRLPLRFIGEMQRYGDIMPAKHQLNRVNCLTIALFVVYFLLLTAVVLFKLPFYSPVADERAINLIPFAGSLDENGRFGLSEVAYNIAFFIPLGIYLCMLKPSWRFWQKLIVLAGLPLAFEVIQFICALGRSDITDLIDNTLGGLIGVALYTIVERLFKDRAVYVINLVALVVTIVVAARFCQLFYLSHVVMGQSVADGNIPPIESTAQNSA